MDFNRIDPTSRETWGTYCVHGHRFLEPDPESPSWGYPTYRYVDPWPCPDTQCTQEAYEAACRAEEEAYHRELAREAYDAVAGSDLGRDLQADAADAEERHGHEANCDPYNQLAGPGSDW